MPQTTTNPRFEKDPNATRDFSVTWEDSEIIVGGATLSSLSVAASPSGLTVGTTGVSSPIGTVRLSGGTLGTQYDVAFSGTFSDGQIDVQHILILIKEIPVGLP